MPNLDFTDIIITALAVVIALSVHEFSHGYAAYKLGDNTAKNMGRLSLNPLRHLDPFGALCMLFFHFGWARPVPIDPRNFKNPKRGFAISSVAGPASNIICAFLSAFFYLLCIKLFVPSEITLLYNIQLNTVKFLAIFHSVNLGLGIFNLIPVPPFDGSRILNVILPPKLYFKIMKHEQKINWFVIAWLFFGGYVYNALMKIPFISSNSVLSAIASVFALSNHISNAIAFLSEAMISFWQLIPFLK